MTIVHRFHEEFCNGRRAELAEEPLTPDFRCHDPQVPGVAGPRAMAEAIAVLQDGLDGRWQVEEVAATEDDRVMARWTGTGTHHAPLMGIPPTGKSVRVNALALFRLEGGKIAEGWTVWDTLGMLRQLGVVPAPAAAAG